MKLFVLCCLAILAHCAVARSPPMPGPDTSHSGSASSEEGLAGIRELVEKIEANVACDQCLDNLDDPKDEEAMFGADCNELFMKHAMTGCAEQCAGEEAALGAIFDHVCTAVAAGAGAPAE